MKKYLIILLIVFIFGCTLFNDDTNKVCTSNCTTIQGRFLTSNDEGLPDIKISLRYIYHSGILNKKHVRDIFEIYTDKDGNYSEQFYIDDSELGDSVDGYFDIEIDDSNLDGYKYIRTDNSLNDETMDNRMFIDFINTRDTVIDKTFYIPKKAFITVNLNNFIPQIENDYFEVRSRFPFGERIGYNKFLDTEYSSGTSGWGTFVASGINSQLNVFVAENQNNIIRIARRKNGVNSLEDFHVFVPIDNSIVLTYDY